MPYVAAADRYDQMRYRRTGRSGLQLPAIALGLWHNFGGDRPLETSRAILRRAFDLGVTHFDLANNYGTPYGSAEANFGRVMREDLRPYRDELIISTSSPASTTAASRRDHAPAAAPRSPPTRSPPRRSPTSARSARSPGRAASRPPNSRCPGRSGTRGSPRC